MRSLLPARLSSAFHTSSPLLAKGWKIDWPKKLACCPHMKSASRSLSAMTMTFSGLADALRASGAADTPAGGPAAKALVALPDTRAATTSCPMGRKPSRSVAGSAIIANRCAGSSPACALVWISGSNLSFVPALLSARGFKLPAVAMLMLSRFAVTTSLAMLVLSKPRMAMCCEGGSPSRIPTTRPRSRSATTWSDLNSTPHEASKGSRCEDLSAANCAIGLLGSLPD